MLSPRSICKEKSHAIVKLSTSLIRHTWLCQNFYSIGPRSLLPARILKNSMKAQELNIFHWMSQKKCSIIIYLCSYILANIMCLSGAFLIHCLSLLGTLARSDHVIKKKKRILQINYKLEH